MDIPEYYPHGNPPHYTEILSKRELTQFCYFINKTYKRACELWNCIPDGIKINQENNVPDYLKIVYPKNT